MEDTAVLNLEYENGSVGNLALTMLNLSQEYRGINNYSWREGNC